MALGLASGGAAGGAVGAARGEVLATDLDRAAPPSWAGSKPISTPQQGLRSTPALYAVREAFDRLVDFRVVDMNQIPSDLTGQFDFCWSACALEHLGSIAQGLDFIERSVACLVPGGVAVHTTEFNCSSDEGTLDHASTVLFRQRDLQHLAKRLQANGHRMAITFDLGDQPLDQHVDIAPYSADRHLKLQIQQWVTTSFGLIIHKSEG
jgi:hypothetical protein